MGSLGTVSPLLYLTTEELRSHSKPGDLWIAIQGKVYDVSEWAKTHPGGDLPLINLAGQDVTDAFVAFHPSHAWGLLDKFHIGHLTDYVVSDVSRDFRRLANEFTKAGLYEKKGHGVATSFVLCAFLLAAAVYGVVGTSSCFVHLLSGAAMGVLWIQSGFVGHDSGHYNVMKTNRINQFTQILTGNCMTGISIGWWKWNHNAHHIACNSLNYDPDLQHIPMFAVSNEFFRSLRSEYFERTMKFDAIARFLVCYQHYTFYVIMPFARFNLFAQSYVHLVTQRNVPNRWLELAGVIFYWIWYPMLVSCLPTWKERIMFVVVSFVVCSIQHVQFTLNHWAGGVYVGRPRGDDWFEKQTDGTVDIECSRWMDWFHGGLQFQVEHHLFPRLPRCHLRKVSPFVKELCKKHNLTYRSASFIEANKNVLRTLKVAAMQARDLSNPVPKNLVWEAMNIHG